MKKLVTIALLLSLSVAAMAQETSKKYDIKSGIAKTVAEVMGQKTEAITYFDNYGALETSRTKTSVPGGGTMEIATISKDGKTYMVNYTAKQVQEMPEQASINYLNLSDDIVKQYNVKEAGKEMIGDRECTKYTSEISQMGQTAITTTWVYKGFPLKSITSVSGLEVKTEVTEFTENAFVIPQNFDIPQY